MKTLSGWWRRDFLKAEGILTVVLTAGFAVWYLGLGGTHVVDNVLNGNRSAVYGALASVAGSLLGFSITAASIIVGYSTNERLAVIQDSGQLPTLWAVFVATIRALAFATVAALLGLIFDRDDSPVGLFLVLTVASIILATLRLWRCLWVFESVIGLVFKATSIDK